MISQQPQVQCWHACDGCLTLGCAVVAASTITCTTSDTGMAVCSMVATMPFICNNTKHTQTHPHMGACAAHGCKQSGLQGQLRTKRGTCTLGGACWTLDACHSWTSLASERLGGPCVPSAQQSSSVISPATAVRVAHLVNGGTIQLLHLCRHAVQHTLTLLPALVPDGRSHRPRLHSHHSNALV